MGAASATALVYSRGMKVTFKMFRGSFKSWANLFREASDFANTLDEGKLISISHSADHRDGIVTVWYRR